MNMMNKEDKRRKIIIIILCLVVIIAVIILLATNNNGDSQRKEENRISSENTSGIIKEDIALDSETVLKEEAEVSGMISENNADKSEKGNSVENMLEADEVLNEKNLPEKSNFDFEAETELIAISEQKDTSFPVSNNSDRSESNNGKDGTSENRQESIGETDSYDEPETPVIPGEGDISDSSEDKTAFEKAQEEARKQGASNYYEFYLNEMSSQEKQNIYDSAPSPAAFLNWVNGLREEYEREQVYSTGDISFDD